MFFKLAPYRKNLDLYLKWVLSMDGDGEYAERSPGEEEDDGEEIEDKVCPLPPISMSPDLTRDDSPGAGGAG